jgi:hypothetical protein
MTTDLNLPEPLESPLGEWLNAQSLGACPAPGQAQNQALSFADKVKLAKAAGFRERTPATVCQQALTISFFFDGTGNNRYQDESEDASKDKSSNIARLFNAHEDAPLTGIIRVYIPGVGTPFPEIGDKGGTLGDAFGAGGEGRLKYAMAKFDEELALAEARAMNPTNKITGIHIAIFGFSRGAAKARAFALRLHHRLNQDDDAWVLRGKGYPLRIYFMGLMDTVASVGTSNTLRNPGKTQAVKSSVEYHPLNIVSGGRLADVTEAVWVNSGATKGHLFWAQELRIPPSVQQCVHYVAAHEVRESFPLDTVRVAQPYGAGAQYPATCREVVYPGVHSNVGGGYAPGEQGRAATLSEQVSQVPLLHLYKEARQAGVPLLPVKQLDPQIQARYKLSPAVAQRFDAYMKRVQVGNASVEKQAMQHLYWFYRWRKVRATAGQVSDGAQARLYRAAAPQRELEAYEEELRRQTRAGRAPRAEQLEILRQKKAAAHTPAVQNAHHELKHIHIEDQRFIEACQALERHATSAARLTLHETTLLAAWREPALTDSDILAFFDEQVHDSVAGFRGRAGGWVGAFDNSQWSRPRDVFQGLAPWGQEEQAARQRREQAEQRQQAIEQRQQAQDHQREAVRQKERERAGPR